MTALAHLSKATAYPAARLMFKSSRINLESTRRCEASFVPQRVLVLTKVSRYMIEKLHNPNLSEEELKRKLIERDINFDAILGGHNRNEATAKKTIDTLKSLNIDFRVKSRYNVDIDSINWADLVIPVGGDGTFLMASNLMNSNSKPIIGINSDPEFSEGFLLLSRKHSSDIPGIFERLRSGNFEYLMRSRVRTTLIGENIWRTPFHMHDQSSSLGGKFYISHHNSTIPKGKLPKTRRIPWLALNEVFIGESLSARISILHIGANGGKLQKVKSSGMCVSTGTGSTSWYRAINCLNPQVVQDVLSSAGLKDQTNSDIEKICSDFNSKIQFPADELQLSYTIRDMILKPSKPTPEHTFPRGFTKKLTIRSQCYDGGLVIDGGIAIHFNAGTTAVLETLKEDALRNIVFTD
ncbi:NAD kinase 2, mitochondrial isoform X1 [Trichogramma pretiosum]|uniref:NAD kinase 2, mitochondrial isoform X1 n=1 Tax=Trichogramma pretiosum TaxID=7493 RepID=UPI0006C9660A|nr:NAD kinase 2, mitochondrial isoform X1 [Trichogramma pretiosum]